MQQSDPGQKRFRKILLNLSKSVIMRDNYDLLTSIMVSDGTLGITEIF